MKLILTVGLPASGKSTWAKEQKGFKRVNKDDLRSMVDNGKFTRGNEKLIVKMEREIVIDLLTKGHNVIVDNTHLGDTNPHIKFYSKLKDVDFSIKSFLDVSVEECIKRDMLRGIKGGQPVGEEVIMSMYQKYLYKPKEISYEESLGSCIIVDIDGTLAHMTGRSPYDYTKVHTDRVDKMIRKIINNHIMGSIELEECDWSDKGDIKVIILSGRKSECEESTKEWLEKNHINYNELYMRADGDNREDSIIKRELYIEHIEGKYNVDFVLDDRNRVVRMWRELGLKCLQVEYGAF